MNSLAHGRNYLINTGKTSRAGPQRERRVKVRTVSPDGRRVKLTMNFRGTLKEPVVVWSDETGDWRPRSLLDKKMIPEWTKNYTLTEATEIA